MAKRNRLWLLFLLGVAVIAMILLSTGLSDLAFRPGQPFPFWFSQGEGGGSPGEGQPLEPSMFDLLFQTLVLILITVILPLWIIVFILSKRARKRMLKQLPVYILWAFIIYSLIRALQRSDLLEGREGEPALFGLTGAPAPGQSSLSPPEYVLNPPQWLVIGLTLLLTSLLLGGIWFLWRRSRPRQSPLTRLAQEAQQALDQLHQGDDLKDTITRCYAQMGQVLNQARGVHRQQAMTPREFEGRLAELGLRDEHIGRLTRLFERFRYGRGAAGAQEEQEAVVCLSAIVQTYGRES